MDRLGTNDYLFLPLNKIILKNELKVRTSKQIALFGSLKAL